jgi:hypothetical protein
LIIINVFLILLNCTFKKEQSVLSEVIYSLKTVLSPAGCIGGQICTTQPSVSVLNSNTKQIVYGFQGSAYIQIGSTPSGNRYEAAYQSINGTDCDAAGYCGIKILGTLASAEFHNGVATFSVQRQKKH